MQIGDEIELDIEKLTNLGLGLARKDSFVYFVEGTCPGDKVIAKITNIKKNYAKAKVSKIITPSEYRTEPFCPMQKVCGACQLQFIDYKHQLKFKQEIVKETLKSIAGIDTGIPLPISSPVTKNYRHKIQYPVSETKNSKRILAGYYKPASHEVVNIKYCPIQPEICDQIIEFIRVHAFDYGISGFNEKKHSGDLRHVLIRNSLYNGKNLVTLVINATKTFDRLNAFCKAIYDEFPEIAGVCVNYNPKKTNVILGSKTECICGNEFIEEKINDKIFFIGSETFFQVNPKSAENIFNYVKDYIKNNFSEPAVLDAYAGISAFGIIVSDVCKRVVTVENNLKSVELAKKSAKLNNVKNISIYGQDTGEFLKKQHSKFDIIIVDPPRKGCTQDSLDNILKHCKSTIIYVSCSPSTLARDLKYLCERGAKIKSIQPFDMFCHTCHIENAAIINL